MAADAWRGWLYTGGAAVLCDPHQALAALVTSLNPSISSGKKGVSARMSGVSAPPAGAGGPPRLHLALQEQRVWTPWLVLLLGIQERYLTTT